MNYEAKMFAGDERYALPGEAQRKRPWPVIAAVVLAALIHLLANSLLPHLVQLVQSVELSVFAIAVAWTAGSLSHFPLQPKIKSPGT